MGSGNYTSASGGVVTVNLAQDDTKPLNYDAWGREKSITDYSLFHGIFTYSVTQDMWITQENGIEILTQSARATSRSGRLVLNSGINKTYLHSRRHPRYQPNRGHLYSSSMFLPNPLRLGERNFGLFTDESGAFFRLKQDGELYAVVRSKTQDSFLLTENGDRLAQEDGSLLISVLGAVVEDEAMITKPAGVDYEKGNIYDIQMQWRGVGNIKFFINLKQIVMFNYLGTLTELSIFNPALPIAFESINLGEEVKLQCGCVDVTSEGGNTARKQYRSVTSGEVTVAATQTPVLLFTISKDVVDRKNTRDCIMQKIEAFADQNTIVRVYYTRDATAFTLSQPMTDVFFGFQKVAYNGVITAVNYAKVQKLHEKRVGANQTIEIANPDPENTEFYLVHGDYVLVTLQAKANTLGGITLVYGEEV